MASPIDVLKSRLHDVEALNCAGAMMDWDQQCLMPEKGASARARHLEHISRMAHEIFVSDETQTALRNAEAVAEPGSLDADYVRIVRRDMDLRTKLPAALVAKKARLSAEGHEAWVKARTNNDFATFAPLLSELFELAKEEAEAIGYKDHIYDALLDQYEEGATAEDCTQMFATLKDPMVTLVKQIKESPNQPDDSFLTADWNPEDQRKFATYLANAVGYDLQAGRIDTAPHPFCTGWSIGDVRITSRFMREVMSSAYSTLHECGHALYEQGSPMEWDGTSLAGGVSLGIHESQSRLWENIVGRSQAFVDWVAPEFKRTFPGLDGYDNATLYRAINKVTPTFIRVEADEVTYNLHVMIRFEIECDILTGKLAVKDLPEAWNAKYTEYLGITPSTNSEGCLQDVHWSMGSIGYFPTYSMGNLLSYQFWNTLVQDIPNTDDLIRAGNFKPILEWLTEKIYRHGRRYSPKTLVQQVTGKPIGATDYVNGLTAKYKAIYGIAD